MKSKCPSSSLANQAFADAYPRQMAAIRACANLPVCHDNISQTLLGLAGLTDPAVYQERLDLASGRFAPQPRFLIKNLREERGRGDLKLPPHRQLSLPNP